MKEKTVNLLVNGLHEALEATGLSALEYFQVFRGLQIPTKYKKFVQLGSKGTFKHLLKQQPEPDRNELAQALAALAALKGAPQKMRPFLKQKLKELPRLPGGAPRKVKPEEEKTICVEIQALRVEYDTREAIRQVARKRGVSDRTIYRIWGKYHPKKKKARQVSELKDKP